MEREWFCTLYLIPWGVINNSCDGASNKNKIKWKDFHVLNMGEVSQFAISRFMIGKDFVLPVLVNLNYMF